MINPNNILDSFLLNPIVNIHINVINIVSTTEKQILTNDEDNCEITQIGITYDNNYITTNRNITIAKYSNNLYLIIAFVEKN